MGSDLWQLHPTPIAIEVAKTTRTIQGTPRSRRNPDRNRHERR
jgi:hypothetical protein